MKLVRRPATKHRAEETDALARQQTWGVLTLTAGALGLALLFSANAASSYSVLQSGAPVEQSGSDAATHALCEIGDSLRPLAEAGAGSLVCWHAIAAQGSESCRS
jgi:hypothetical protein